ncbi:uncharacterized protein LOC130420437 [Triplophysa dalaica]|uniref:uncharacterized protein LOC130420437 n=1 Tax=Triplophysa dalaica TaxID=1582913 RepID=UPI0024DF4D72|nr:uncharacterized protein LOC130420437 [Triplophysa dalaica]
MLATLSSLGILGSPLRWFKSYLSQQILQGVSGAQDVFISSGESVSLSCNDALHQCSSTTWNYSKNTTSSAVEVFAGGINENNTERPERLSLTSDCSLNIYNTTQHDGGLYTCTQYMNEHHHDPDSDVYLHVLHVSSSSSSSSQTEIRANTSVTLSCQLFTYFCYYLFSYDGFQLVWMNQTDVDLHTDSRYQIRSDELCLISLTTTLVNEDDNTELVACKNDNNGTFDTINIGPPTPSTNEQKDDVVYSEVTVVSKKQLKNNNVQSAGDVTCAAIRGGKTEPEDA